MAIGFKPQVRTEFEADGQTNREILLSAQEAASELGWRIGYVTPTEAVFYTSVSFWSWEEKVTVKATEQEGKVRLTSTCTHMQLMDWGKNKANLKKLVSQMQRSKHTHRSGKPGQQSEPYTTEEKSAIDAHIRKYFGRMDAIIHAHEGTNNGPDIILIAPTSRDDYYTLLTRGAGSRKMTVPDKTLPDRCEFCLCLPPDWNPESPNAEDRWPMAWLEKCALLPTEEGVWLTCGHTVSEGTPLHTGTEMDTWILTAPEERDEAAAECTLPGGDKVAFYELVPLYREEAEYKQAYGLTALLDKMKKTGHICHTHRPNTCAGFNPFPQEENPGIRLEDETQITLRSILTPRKGNLATPILTYINIAVFLLMAVSGVGIFLPEGLSLLKWGADFGPLTLTGEWWRALTCNFIHIGIIHLLMNMYAMLYIGAYLEPLVRTSRLFVAYLLTGLCSAGVSLAAHPETLSAGASGAIFGLYGIFLAYLLFHRIEKHQRKSLLWSIGLFVVYNLLNGFTHSGIDNAAHIGGLVSGFLLGLGYVQADQLQDRGKSVARAAEGLLLAAFVGLFMVLVRKAPADYRDIKALWDSGELEQYVTDEPTTIESTEGEWTEYTRKEPGFSCSYPTYWHAQEGENNGEGQLLLLVNGYNTVNISYARFESEKELEELDEVIPLSVPECPPETLRIGGKEFKRLTTRRDYPVAGVGTLNMKQTVAYRMDRDSLEGFIVVMMISDKELEKDAELILQSIRIEQ